MRLRRSIALVLTLGAVLAPARAPAMVPVAVVTIVAYQYLPGDSDPATLLQVEHGARLFLVNLDTLGAHNLVAIDVVDDRPLFDSDLINTGEATEVRRVPSLASGSYAFMCTVHGFDAMNGTLVVV